MRESGGVEVPGALGAGGVLGGRYRLIEPIGRGGMADVFRGEDEVLRRPVAVKVFRADGAVIDERRIEVEVRTVAGLQHPGLVTVFDAGVSDGSSGALPYLVMELVSGPTLAQRLTAGPLGPEQAELLAANLAAALQYVHQRGVVHRDIKPANILLGTDPGQAAMAAKLTDFGIARLADGARLTLHGTKLGTANYLSPEQAGGAQVGPSSDVYSFGLVLIECLTGELAYPGVGIEAAAARLHRAPEIPDAAGPAWARLLAAMTDREPARRPTAAQVVTAVSDLDGSAIPATRTPADISAAPTAVLAVQPRPTALLPAPARPGWRARSRRVLLAAAALLAVVLVVTGVALSAARDSGRPSPPPSYPAVSGPLGTDLAQLERAIP